MLDRAAQAERAHVGPDLVDVGKAVRLEATEAVTAPAGRHVTVGWPDRVLLLVVEYHEVGLVVVHVASSGSFGPGQQRPQDAPVLASSRWRMRNLRTLPVGPTTISSSRMVTMRCGTAAATSPSAPRTSP